MNHFAVVLGVYLFDLLGIYYALEFDRLNYGLDLV